MDLVYLYGRKFTLRTDHQALTTLLATSRSGHRSLIDFTGGQCISTSMTDIEYVSGFRNQVADMLSCITPEMNTNNEVISEVDTFVNTVIPNATANLVPRNELKWQSKQDETLQRVCCFLQTE